MAVVDTETGLYVPANSNESRDALLEDLTYLYQQQGVAQPPTQVGSDNWLRTDAFGRGLYLAHQNIEYKSRETFNVSSTEEASVQEKAEMLGVSLPGAQVARGRIRVTAGATVTLNETHTFVLPNGMVGKVEGVVTGVVDGSEVPVVLLTSGKAGNAKGGTKVKFLNTPVGVATDALVSELVPLTGGTDDPTIADLKAAVQWRLQNPVGAGNPGDLVQAAKNSGVSLASVSVYCAPGGPATVKVVPLKPIYPEQNDYARTLDQDALARVRAAVQAKTSWADEVHVVNANHYTPTNMLITLSVDKGGWVDPLPWPAVKTTVYAATSAAVASIQVHHTLDTSTTQPVVGQSIMWWSSATRSFVVRAITAVSGTGPWTLTLDAPFVDSANNVPLTGDYISPVATQHEALGAKLRDMFGALVPGENVLENWRSARTGDPGDSYITERNVRDECLSVEGIKSAYLYEIANDVPPAAAVTSGPYVLVMGQLGFLPES